MPLGINQTMNITQSQIDSLINVSNLCELAVKVNIDVYSGYLFFVLMLTLWIILYFSFQKANDQPLNNIMYSGAVVSILSLMMRGVYLYTSENILQGLLTDSQMWIFPLVTILIGTVVWMTKK